MENCHPVPIYLWSLLPIDNRLPMLIYSVSAIMLQLHGKATAVSMLQVLHMITTFDLCLNRQWRGSAIHGGMSGILEWHAVSFCLSRAGSHLPIPTNLPSITISVRLIANTIAVAACHQSEHDPSVFLVNHFRISRCITKVLYVSTHVNCTWYIQVVSEYRFSCPCNFRHHCILHLERNLIGQSFSKNIHRFLWEEDHQ